MNFLNYLINSNKLNPRYLLGSGIISRQLRYKSVKLSGETSLKIIKNIYGILPAKERIIFLEVFKQYLDTACKNEHK